MKIGTKKGIRKGGKLVVYFEYPQEGVNFRRLSMALSLLLSEKDISEYLKKDQEDLSLVTIEEKVLAKSS